MNCETLKSQIHFRADLSAAEAQSFSQHVEACEPCRGWLHETEGLEDLWLHFEAPPQPLYSGVVDKILRGEGPTSRCEDVRRTLYDLVNAELAPWESRPLEKHLEACAPCTKQVREVKSLNTTLASWKAPTVAPGLAEKVLAQLDQNPPAPQPNPEPTREAPSSLLARWRGPLTVSRAAAALVLVAVSLATALLTRDWIAGNEPRGLLTSGAGTEVSESPPALSRPRFASPILAMPVGRFDSAGAFPADLTVPARGSILQDIREW